MSWVSFWVWQGIEGAALPSCSCSSLICWCYLFCVTCSVCSVCIREQASKLYLYLDWNWCIWVTHSQDESQFLSENTSLTDVHLILCISIFKFKWVHISLIKDYNPFHDCHWIAMPWSIDPAKFKMIILLMFLDFWWYSLSHHELYFSDRKEFLTFLAFLIKILWC